MSERLGGKAGAAKHGEDFDEHGYHIFMAHESTIVEPSRPSRPARLVGSLAK